MNRSYRLMHKDTFQNVESFIIFSEVKKNVNDVSCNEEDGNDWDGFTGGVSKFLDSQVFGKIEYTLKKDQKAHVTDL